MGEKISDPQKNQARRIIAEDALIEQATVEWFPILWVRVDWTPFDEHYIEIRERVSTRMEEERGCWICKKPFEPGEMQSLIGMAGLTNRTACSGCGKRAYRSLEVQNEKTGDDPDP